MKNKRGWIKIVEAFASILLIAGALIVIINSLGLKIPDSSLLVYDSEYAILREIQLDNNLRGDILSETISVGGSDAPVSVKDKINLKKPAYLECEAKLCEINDKCTITSAPNDKDIFVQSAFFGANQADYAKRKLNLFCWIEG